MDTSVAAKIDDFFSKYPEKHFDKGYILASANEDLPGIIHLIEGQVRQYDITSQGGEVVVNVFKPPAFFPMSWAINRMPNRYFFEAATSLRAHIAPPEEAIAFLQSNPDVMFDLLARLYSGVEGIQRRMAHLMGGTAKTRLLFELITEIKRFGTKQPDGSYTMALHEDELARRAGLTRETVNREIMELKRSSKVSVDHKQLTVGDLSALEHELGDDL